MKTYFLFACKGLIGRGCLAFLAHLWETFVEVLFIESVSVVCEFQEFFPKGLPGMPPSCDVDYVLI